MRIITACEIIKAASNDSVIVATMGSMVAFDKLKAGQPRLSSVPLMGRASGLGLGIALGRPDCNVIVVDGDASLVMQLGALVTVSIQKPANLHHFVINNGTQFTGMSNLPTPGADRVDFCGLAKSAGYSRVFQFGDERALSAGIRKVLDSAGPTFVELLIEPEPATFGADQPQQDWGELQFTRMGDEARRLKRWLADRSVR